MFYYPEELAGKKEYVMKKHSGKIHLILYVFVYLYH